ncbi:hypothetical protein AAFC00_002502 [Neodothiora populina]|uniref:Peptidase A1 domain-containing protein n=1 Tax=Neodothiora populina TaxID=2781224 RepID=A0ABR3P7B0_9PEZI
MVQARPWNALLVGVDSPPQNLTFLPSLTKSTLLISDGACSSQSSVCPLPLPNFWLNSSAHAEFVWIDSPSWDASTWDATVSEPLQLDGQGLLLHETLQLYNQPKTNINGFVNQAMALTQDMTVNYPDGTNYTMDVGFFSVYGAADNQTWTSTNGSKITLDSTLPSVYNGGVIPSTSYSLHMGSASLEVPGSLVLGGYDRSRCLTTPITSDSSVFQLHGINIGVRAGASAFIGATRPNISSIQLLSGPELTVLPNPGVPYMYLPRATCDAIAEYLPVNYNADKGLYIWNTSNPAYQQIVSSPHTLSFTFASSTSGSNDTIHIPFALLNLTLDSPIVNPPLQYFPCSPYSPSDSTTYHLGRAFLQGAFLAQHWQTNTTWLAQAPGPAKSSENIINLEPEDTTLAAMVNGPNWYSTWQDTLKPLANDKPGEITDSLSGGAIAGIVVGVVVGVLLVVAAVVFFFIRRRRARSSAGANAPGDGDDTRQELKDYPTEDNDHAAGASTPLVTSPSEAHSRHLVEAPYTEIHEIAGSKNRHDDEDPFKDKEMKLAEMEDRRSPVAELPTN